VEIVEDAAGDSLIDQFSDSAAIERRHRSPAGHRLGQHQPERLVGLNGIEQRPRAAQ